MPFPVPLAMSSAACRNERDDPIRKIRDLRVGKHDDIAVDIELVLGLRIGVAYHAFAMGAPFIGEHGLTGERGPCHVLDLAITILVGIGQKSGLGPAFHPRQYFHLFDRPFVQRIDEVVSSEDSKRRSSRIKESDKE